MSKKKIINVFLYLFLQSILAFCEKKTNFYGLGLAFCLTLVFCKENVFLSVLSYALASGLVHFSLLYLPVLFSGVFLVLMYVFILSKIHKKQRLWANIIILTVSQIPTFFLFGENTEMIIKIALSPFFSSVFHTVSVVAAYPILVRGMRYKFTEKEKIFAVLFTLPLGAGLASFSVFGVNFFLFFVLFFCLLLVRFNVNGIGFAVALGAGASLITRSPFACCAASVMGGIVFACRPFPRYLGAVMAFGGFMGCLYWFDGGLSAFTVLNTVPVAAACLVVLIPNKVFDRAKGYRQSFYGKFALRTAANRDREEVGEKLRNVAYAFRKMQTILECEGGERIKPEQSADRIFEECCAECGKYAVCKEKCGGDVRKKFAKLLSVGTESGKVNLLDIDGELGGRCVRLPKVINVTNAVLREYREREERRSGAEQGKAMVIGNLGGTAELLDELASSVRKGFGFDVEGERRITDELAYANVIAGDATIYGAGEKITLAVRECDEKKKELTQIVSEAVGTDVYVSERSGGVNGTVNLVLRPVPEYGVLFGEKSVSAESVSGDASQAVRVTADKLMFVLSDGMGTGENARRTGTSALDLIETFYRAGFSHKTIFSSVSRLLALRSEETFSALDVAVMDTRTGEIDFIKQGGRESYVVSERGVEVIEGGALPMGIIEDGKPIIVKRKVRGNDLVVLLSDGVADRLNQSDITEIIGNLNTLNPQIIAEKIIENAIKKKEGHRDDMTAMTMRIVQNKR